MAITLHAKQIAELKTHFMQPTTNFANKVLALRALLGMRRLGLRTRRWATKKLFWLQNDSEWISADPVEQAERNKMLDELVERNELAIKKYETRIANKQPKQVTAIAPTEDPLFTKW